jgi:type VI secretion system secreted protein VgrG
LIEESDFGFYRELLLIEAGRAQQAAGTSRPEWGYPPSSRFDIYGGQPPYGDDPDDQEEINRGVDFRRCMGY